MLCSAECVTQIYSAAEFDEQLAKVPDHVLVVIDFYRCRPGLALLPCVSGMATLDVTLHAGQQKSTKILCAALSSYTGFAALQSRACHKLSGRRPA